MSANVIPLDRARPERPTECGCPRCELDALATRIQSRQDDAVSLLVPIDEIRAILDDVRATTARLLPNRAVSQ